jgi:hypothetical protein
MRRTARMRCCQQVSVFNGFARIAGSTTRGPLRILIQYLTTPTDDWVPPFFRIVDADPHWRHYLFGRQRPETRVETMSWYWRFLLMMTLVRKLT